MSSPSSEQQCKILCVRFSMVDLVITDNWQYVILHSLSQPLTDGKDQAEIFLSFPIVETLAIYIYRRKKDVLKRRIISSIEIKPSGQSRVSSPSELHDKTCMQSFYDRKRVPISPPSLTFCWEDPRQSSQREKQQSRGLQLILVLSLQWV